LSGGDAFLRQWQVSDGAEKNAFRLETKLSLLATLTTPDGKTAIQVSADEKIVRVNVFDTVVWKKIREIELAGHPTKIDERKNQIPSRATWRSAFFLSPDGSLIGDIVPSGRVAVWDSTTGQLVRMIGDPNHRIHKAMFMPDGTGVLTIDSRSPISVWDLKTSWSTSIGLVNPVSETFGSSTWATSPNGKTLAVATLIPGLGYAIRLISLDNGGTDAVLQLSKVDDQSIVFDIRRIAFAPDAKSVVVSNSGDPSEWWRVPIDGKGPLRIPTGERSRNTESALSHDGKTLATCNVDGVIRLWDVATGKERPSPNGHRGPVAAVAFQRDGAVVTASLDASVRFWDSASGKQKAITATGEGRFSTRMALSPNGRWLIKTKSDFGSVESQILDTATGDVRYRLNISPNREYLFTGGGKSFITQEQDGTPKEWDLSNGKKLRVGVPGASGRHRLSPDGEILVSVDNSNCVGVNMSAGKEVFRWGLLQKNVFQETLGQANHEYVTDAAISPDGTTIALGLNCGQPAAGRIVPRIARC
jgi:WD40 repeat protein